MELVKSFEGFYRFLWPESQARPDLSFLEEPFKGVSRDFLFDLAKEARLDESQTVLDLGCGTGAYAADLVTRFGCHVIGVDPLESNIAFCEKKRESSPMGNQMAFRTGFAENIPLEENSVDFIWFRDALTLVQYLPKCFEECKRVLRPGGKVLIYTGMRSRQIPPEDMEKICVPMGMPPASLEKSFVESAISSNGFNILLSESTNDENARFHELVSEGDLSAFKKYCKLIRSKSTALELLGDQNYRYLESLYLWNIYVLMDKIHYQVYLLE